MKQFIPQNLNTDDIYCWLLQKNCSPNKLELLEKPENIWYILYLIFKINNRMIIKQ